MRPHPHDPRRLDVERFAADGARLEGDWPLAAMTRLVGACDEAFRPGTSDSVVWSAAGERRRSTAQGAQAWLRLVLHAKVELTCQRCLSPVAVTLDVDRWFRFVAGEQQAAALDAESDDDVLASSRSFDLFELAEDELLLALPLVARHEACPQPLAAPAAAAGASDAPDIEASPFAALAALRRSAH